MKAEVFPSTLKGSVAAPGSKSIAQRMVACALLAKGESVIREFPESDDCIASLDIAQSLGAIVSNKNGVVSIKGGFPNAFLSGIRYPKDEIFCGESGLSSRMFVPIVSLYDKPIRIQGKGTLLKRTFADFDSILPSLGVKLESNHGFLPLTVCGPLQGGELSLEATGSSQFLTGMLIALPRAGAPSKLLVQNLKSKPYVTMTLEIMEKFGVKVYHQDLREFEIPSANYSTQNLVVPGDWSGAAFLLVAGALCAEEGLTVTNINRYITQADSSVIEALQRAGVKIELFDDAVKVYASDIKAFEFDAEDCPDLFPPLVALAAFADGVTTIRGIKRLVNKESNRAKTLQQEFAAANIRITLRDDEMKIYPAPVRRAVINSHNDHRIAMAAAVLGLAGDRMTIKGAECVAKSYPDFFRVLENLQGKVQYA